jgi:catechol 2,3-dioxygenase-like lactoylglutathione lyase family enzyme
VIRHIVHVNINVSDIERSVEFYRLLGFELMHVLADEPTDDVRQLMHFGGRTTRGAVMSLGDDPLTSTKVELLEPVDPPAEPQGVLPENRVGFSRLALRTRSPSTRSSRRRASSSSPSRSRSTWSEPGGTFCSATPTERSSS